jgi:hypothetical protein
MVSSLFLHKAFVEILHLKTSRNINKLCMQNYTLLLRDLRFKTAMIVIGCMKPDLSNAENINLTFFIFSRICGAEVE